MTSEGGDTPHGYAVLIYSQSLRAWAVPLVVETLEEAREVALEHVIASREPGDVDDEWQEAAILVQRLPASGGAVGPLPDGYVIEVRPCFSIRGPA
jgi:hypothetical protein